MAPTRRFLLVSLIQVPNSHQFCEQKLSSKNGARLYLNLRRQLICGITYSTSNNSGATKQLCSCELFSGGYGESTITSKSLEAIIAKSSHYFVDKLKIKNFRVEQETCTINISVGTSNMGTEETAIKVEPPSEETLDETQSNLLEEASSLEEPTSTFSIEQLLKLTTKKQRKSPIKSVPERLKNEKYYENRKKNAQASRLWRERKKKLDQERLNLIHSSLQEVEQLKMELEGYKPLVEKYSQLQKNYAALQQIVAKFLASRQH